MRNYRPGDVILVSFPFVDTTETKRRPAVVLLDVGDDDVVVARVTSQIAQTAFDIKLMEWPQEGLLLPSVVRVHKVATAEKRLVERQLRRLTDSDWARVRAKVQQLWGLI